MAGAGDVGFDPARAHGVEHADRHVKRTLHKLIEWLRGWLPDRCEMPGCLRHGVRGNENIIDGKRVCDYCHVRMTLERQ